MLWSPGSKEKGAEGSGSAPLDIGGTGEDLPALAKKFKERFGEEVASDEGDDAMVVSGDALDTPVRKRGLNGGAGPRTPVEEVAQSMSPAKLAAEIQKARARAREQRFGGRGAGGSKPTAAPRGAPAARIPLDFAASGQKKNGAVSASSASSLPQEVPGRKGSVGAAAAAAAAAAARKAPRLAQTTSAGGPSASTASVSATAVTKPDGPASRVTPTAGSPFTASNRASVRRTAAPGPSTGSAAAPVVVRADTGEVDTSAASKTGRAAAAAAPEAIPMDEPPAATTSAAAPKRPAPDGGDVVVIEPPAKKVAQLPAKTSPPPPSRLAGAGAAGGKVHTLRLRLRTEAAAEAKQPGRVVPPGTGGAGSNGGGVEECKGFDPPNPRPDGGVEECKGFDPPNLPPASKSRQQNASPAASPAITMESAAPTTPSGTSPAVAVSTPAPAGVGAGGTAPNSAAKPSSTGADVAVAPSTSALAREGSWGPSFGILGTTEARPVPATPAPSPVTRVAPPNPWILSPEAPTFARNQGRPLAPSFRKPSPAAGGGNGGGARTAAGNATGGSAGRAAASEGNDAAAIGRPVIPGGGGNSARGGLGGRRTSSESKAPTGGSPRQTSTPTLGRALPVGRVTGGKDGGLAVQPQASNGVNPGLSFDATLDARQGVAGASPPSAAAEARAESVAAGGVAAAAAEASAAGAEEEVAAPEGQLVLGVHLSGSAAQLLARLKREREESLDHERKLTQALLDC